VIELGMIAYEAYGDSRAWKTVGGTDMPTWDDQSEELRQAWRDAANAVAHAIRVEDLR
jgi:hypothetical protein